MMNKRNTATYCRLEPPRLNDAQTRHDSGVRVDGRPAPQQQRDVRPRIDVLLKRFDKWAGSVDKEESSPELVKRDKRARHTGQCHPRGVFSRWQQHFDYLNA
jgi:hypothetical protein